MSIFQEGYDAYNDGGIFSDNPYAEDSAESSEWVRGFEEAEGDEMYEYDYSLSCGCCSCCGCSCYDYEDEEEEL